MKKMFPFGESQYPQFSLAFKIASVMLSFKVNIKCTLTTPFKDIFQAKYSYVEMTLL